VEGYNLRRDLGENFYPEAVEAFHMFSVKCGGGGAGKMLVMLAMPILGAMRLIVYK
jgi:hypothetical protein